MIRALAALAVALVLAGPVAAQECATLADLEDELICPTCNTTLELSRSPVADRMRDFIRERTAECATKEEIKAELVAQFGEEVLALPGDEGDDDLGDVLVYVIPAIAIVLAAGGIAFAVVRWRGAGARRGRPSPAAAADSSRVDTDMERYDL